jgi:Ser/Thr protein kinase RdoA (MazF antagonist)
MVEWYVPIHEGIESDKYCELAIDEASDIIPTKFLDRRSEFWPTARKALLAHGRQPQTIIHNDSHLGNVYLTENGVAGLSDWACVCSGLWARDFAYAVTAMLSVEQRRAWEADLLRLYIDAMHEAAGREITSFEEGWNHYRRQIALALIVWLPTLKHHPDMPDMQPEALSREMVLRMTTAMADLDSFDA